MDIVKFKEWIWEKFVEWRGRSDRGITDFAAYLGVHQPTLSGWVKGPHTPRGRNLAKVAARYPDVYTVLGFPPASDIELQEGLPSEFVSEFQLLFDEIRHAIERAGLDPESPEAVKISNEILDDFVSRRSTRA